MDTHAIELRRASPKEAAGQLADELEVGLRAAREEGRPFVLGLATGQTMRPVWDELACRQARGSLSLGRVRAFALDEYCGLPAGHPESMRAELERGLLARVDLPPEQLQLPDVHGSASLEERCEAYERALRVAGGVDLQLLGVGANGHVAFNEPGSAPDSRTRRVHLAPETRAAAAARFGGPEAVPSAALTMGIATIREARALRIFAFGAAKAAAVRRAAAGGPERDWPVTLLAGHSDLRLFADDAACEQV
ncbi:MAG: glucosamine-6-phosphate deaminase [Planctomycetota bacterium]